VHQFAGASPRLAANVLGLVAHFDGGALACASDKLFTRQDESEELDLRFLAIDCNMVALADDGLVDSHSASCFASA
jgi:hypothetical protein